jgi:uncharacterized protein
VKDELKGVDSSHDYAHIERVCNLAERLAKEEGIEDIELVLLASLLHDIADWKYSGSETAGPHKAKQWLISQGYTKADKVVAIIQGVSFKNELDATPTIFPELSVVQDADRLDALGAIGIARAWTFGGARNRPLWCPETDPTHTRDLSKAEYVAQHGANSTSTVSHFYDKLLKLKDLMKTQAGKRIAQQRHQVMEAYLAQFYAEWKGDC